MILLWENNVTFTVQKGIYAVNLDISATFLFTKFANRANSLTQTIAKIVKFNIKSIQEVTKG